jgi:glycosyltransferase involved in cell wall biosynthesis/predicted metal-dependent phosphoesterase TrpH
VCANSARLRALQWEQVLVGENPLGELDEPVVDSSVGRPHLTEAQEPPTGTPQGEGEGAQRYLEPKVPALEQSPLGARGDRRRARRHAAKVLEPALTKPSLFTKRSRHLRGFFTGMRDLQANLVPMSESRRADMHVHSTASELSKLGVQRSLQLPECATPPEEVYELAKRRGMDFVTITDHDTIAGALTLDHLPDTFISEELTAWFKGEPQAVHVLCYGIDRDDHDWLQAHNDDVEACAEYLHSDAITAALAHPFYAVEAPLTAAHRRRLAALFPIWETRNGSRAKELNLPAFVYIETHGGTAIGGSDDHAGIDIGRTFTETPYAATPNEFLTHIRAGRVSAHGAQGSAAKWTHAAMALAIRSFVSSDGAARPSPGAVLKIVERVMREGDVRQGAASGDLGPEDARALLRGWIDSMDLGIDERNLLELLQDGEISHPDLYRRGRRIHERKLAAVVDELIAMTDGRSPLEPQRAAVGMFDACIPAIPYAAAAAFLGREKFKLTRSDGDRPRVALVADGLGGMHGVTHTIQQIRDRGVPGFDVEVIGTDADVDRRLSAVAEVDIPFYRGLQIGVPSVPAIVEALAEGRYDLVHLPTPGPAGIGAWVLARVLDIPVLGSYHTELAAYTGLRTGQAQLEAMVQMALATFYGSCDLVLSPSHASDERLRALGIADERIGRWARGVDLERFDPALRKPEQLPGEFVVLYAGRLTKEKGVDLLANAFLAAKARDPRLHLALAGGGPEEEHLRELLGDEATFLGWLHGEELARTYASANAFMFASQTDTYGQVIVEAQASGLPVVAVAEGGPASLIQQGETGLLSQADPEALAKELLRLAGDDLLYERIRRAALASVRGRTWDVALEQLAAGYRTLLSKTAAGVGRKVA